MAHSPSARPVRAQPIAPAPATIWERCTQAAFVLSLALVCCRLLTGESIRNPADPLAGGPKPPASPGPACAIVLDLLFCLPALFVLARRAFDDRFRLTFFWSYVPMALLGLLVALSPLWAADRFAAVISASNVCCALIFIWSSSQLLRSWNSLRLTAGVCVGLAMALASVGYSYRFVEMVDLRQMWQEQKSAIIASHGWKEGSYEARMFENRVLRGQPMGFSSSTNTYAALLVLLGVVSAGVAIQRAADGHHWGWTLAPAAASAAVILPLYWTSCRAALVTPIIAALMLIIVALNRRRLARFATLAYALGVGAFASIATIVIRHGLRTGNLWHDSLNFRWLYWVGSYRALVAGLDHSPRQYFQLFLGVGWENFGPYYLMHRLPRASEEIRDPHNFIVRAFVELGLIGGTIVLAWMLRLWWDLTRPVFIKTAEDEIEMPASSSRRQRLELDRRDTALKTVLIIAFASIAINIAASVDFGSDAWYVFLEIIRRILFFCAILLGLSRAALRVPAGAAVRRASEEVHFELDSRPAPWMVYSILAGLGTFLIHNLIEFSLFEPGPLFLFALLVGQALGVRSKGTGSTLDVLARFGASDFVGSAPRTIVSGSRGTVRSADPTQIDLAAKTPPQKRGMLVARITVMVAAGAWLAAAIFLAAPVIGAEALVHDADDNAFAAAALRGGKNASPGQAQELVARAAGQLAQAWQSVPWNADYASQAARMLISASARGQNVQEITKLLDAAVRADPSSVEDLVLRAQYGLSTAGDYRSPDLDYERALMIDPNNVRLRLDFARALQRQSGSEPARGGQALTEFYRALDMDAGLDTQEIKRLSPKELAEARQAIAQLDHDPKSR